MAPSFPLDVRDFKGDKWIRDKDLEQRAMAPAVARTFKLAAGLYGIFSLLSPAVVSWAESAGHASLLGKSMGDSVQTWYRTELLDLIRKSWPKAANPVCFTWPLAVVEVTVADMDQPQDREFCRAGLV